jgi:hypothetical protein
VTGFFKIESHKLLQGGATSTWLEMAFFYFLFITPLGLALNHWHELSRAVLQLTFIHYSLSLLAMHFLLIAFIYLFLFTTKLIT